MWERCPNFVPYVLQLPLQDRLHFWTEVLFLAQREQFLDFGQREAQLLSVPHEREVTNLLSTKQAITARASRHRDQTQLLVEADRVYAYTGLLRRLPRCALSASPRLR